MLYINLDPIFEARQIDNPYRFLVKSGFSSQTATRIAGKHIKTLQTKHIEVLCRLLYCEPNDLLAWKPDVARPLAESHPLNNLVPKADGLEWAVKLNTMPLAELREMFKAK